MRPAPMVNNSARIESEAMHPREITLPDGRYMIFYTFGVDEAATVVNSQVETTAEEETAPSAEAGATPPL